jgi:hypothetical protein
MLGVSRQSTAIPRVEAAILTGTLKAAKDKRLSIKECRALLETGCTMQDTEIELFRDLLYAMADIATVEHAKKLGNRERRLNDKYVDESKAA